jgi:hypothetical protein
MLLFFLDAIFTMISKPALRMVIADQLKEFESLRDSVPRSLLPKAVSYKGSSAFVVKGVRRCGKSTLLRQLVKARFANKFFYFNFDDERILGFSSQDFQPLMETLVEAFGEQKNVFFDEIQNVPGWELFVNRILRQGYKIFITGSSAHLLSKELGTHLTGRHVDLELYPFSFAEFLKAKNIDTPKKGFYSTEQKALFFKHFKEYLLKGGMPEVVVFSNEAVLTQVLNDIIQKDIVNRYSIRKPTELKSVLKFLIANAANLITFRSIVNNFAIKSPNTVQKYVEYAEETYLAFTVQRFEKKLKRFDKNPKKLYCVDNGIVTRNTPTMVEKKGALLENAVAVHLKRLGKEFYYYKGKTGAECDFVLPKEKTAMQVCYQLSEDNRDREIKGLLEAAGKTKATKALILTMEQEQEIKRQKKRIVVKPAWKWLLENETSK